MHICDIFALLKYGLKHILSSQLFRNSSWSLLDLGIYPLLMIVATPFFIHTLGPAQYGLWMLISNITQLMNAMNMGVGDSTIRQVSRMRASGDVLQLRSMVNTNLSTSCILLGIAALAGFLFSTGIERFNWFGMNDAAADAPTIMMLASLSAGFKFIESVMLSVFRGYERFDISARLSLVSRNSVVIAALIVAAQGNGLREIVGTTVIVNILNLLVQAVVLKRFAPDIALFPRFHPGLFAQAFASNLWYWVQSVIALAGYLSDKFLVAFFTDLTTLGYYSIASMIGSQVHNILLAFGSFIFPKVSFLNQLQNDSKPVYLVSRFAIAGAGWCVLGILLLAGPFIFPLWLGQDTYSAAAEFIRLYLVSEALILLIIVPYHFLNGTEHVRLNSFFELALRTSHVVLMLIMYQVMGVTGLIWGQIIATCVNLPIQYFWFHRTVFGNSSWKQALTPVLPAMLFGGFLFVPAQAMIGIAALVVVAFKVIYYNPAKEMLNGGLGIGN